MPTPSSLLIGDGGFIFNIFNTQNLFYRSNFLYRKGNMGLLLTEELTIDALEEGNTYHEATFSERYEIVKDVNKITIVLLPHELARKSPKEIVNEAKGRFKIDDKRYVMSSAFRNKGAGFKMVFYKL